MTEFSELQRGAIYRHKDGRDCRFIATDPDDGACLIVEHVNRVDGDICHYFICERSDLSPTVGMIECANPACISKVPVMPGDEGVDHLCATCADNAIAWEERLAAADMPLPEWAERRSDGEYMEVGAQLLTRDGRRHGNAYVDRVFEPLFGDWIATVVTDMGNSFRMNIVELEEGFYPPAYVMKLDEARAKRGVSSEPPPTDRDRLKALLTDFGVEFEDSASNIRCSADTEKVGGYMGFYTIFRFDVNGKFTIMGAFE